MNPLTVTFLVALTVSFSVLLVSLRSAPASKAAVRRLTTIQDSVRAPAAGAYGTDLKDADRRGGPARLSSVLERYRFAKKLKVLLLHANSGLEVGEAVLASGGVALACGLVCFLVSRSLTVAVLAATAGSAFPSWALIRKRDARVKAFNAALPDAIDLMARSLRAGHAVGSAIEMVADQSPEPLAFEFVQVYQQQRLGLQFRDALLEMGTRVPSQDLQFLITAILVQKETGGDLTEILDRASHVIRERIRIQGEVRTRTAQGRLTGWILSFLPVVMLILINLVNPGYSRVLFHDPIGKDLLYAALVMIVIGAVIINRIVDVKV